VTRRTTTVTSAVLLLVTLVCVALLLPVPYVTLSPGPTLDTLGEQNGRPVISIEGDVRTYDDGGQLDLVTVSVTSPDAEVGLADAFQAWFDPAAALVPRDLIYPSGETAQQADEQTKQQMTGSQTSSEVAGLIAVGYPGVVAVAEVAADGPADGQVRVDDRIVSVDGRPVASPDQVIDAVSGRTPGDPVRLGVRRGDAVTQTVTLTTVAAPDDLDVARIGVSIVQDVDADVEITNNVGQNIGGPSAGTMFALAIYDKLTPGSLTGGQTVAGTGEISADGVVGPIGGVQQKIVGARDDGASIFLVPAENCGEALGADVDPSEISLVRISTLDDAVASLEAIAADPQAEVPTC